MASQYAQGELDKDLSMDYKDLHALAEQGKELLSQTRLGYNTDCCFVQ